VLELSRNRYLESLAPKVNEWAVYKMLWSLISGFFAQRKDLSLYGVSISELVPELTSTADVWILGVPFPVIFHTASERFD
jgi:hypothetical protein